MTDSACAKAGTALVRAVKIVGVGGFVIGDQRAAHFHRIRRHARAFRRHADGAGGARKGGVDRLLVAIVEIETDIVRDIVVHLHRARRHGALDADQHRQILIVDLDQIGGVARGVLRLGDNDCDFLAGKAHAVARQHRALRHQHRPDRHGRAAAESAARLAKPASAISLAGQHRQHAGRGSGRLGVDRLDDGMRPVGAAKGGIGLAVEIEVVGVAALAGDEAPVFAPAGIFEIQCLTFALPPCLISRPSSSHVQRSGQQSRRTSPAIAEPVTV